jgi:hypothetical protein
MSRIRIKDTKRTEGEKEKRKKQTEEQIKKK